MGQSAHHVLHNFFNEAVPGLSYLLVGDMHIHPDDQSGDVVRYLTGFIDEFRPEIAVFLGDLVDGKKIRDIMAHYNPDFSLKEGAAPRVTYSESEIKDLVPALITEVRDRFQLIRESAIRNNTQIVVTLGNHDRRINTAGEHFRQKKWSTEGYELNGDGITCMPFDEVYTCGQFQFSHTGDAPFHRNDGIVVHGHDHGLSIEPGEIIVGVCSQWSPEHWNEHETWRGIVAVGENGVIYPITMGDLAQRYRH